MIRRLVGNRACQFAALVAVVLAGRLLPDGEPRPGATLPAHDAFFARLPAAVEDPGPTAVAVRILRAHTRFPEIGADAAAGAIRELATAVDGERLAAKVREDLETLQNGYPGGRTLFWVGPLGTREASLGADRMQVDVWFSRVVAPPRSPAYQEWRVAQVELARENAGWRLADYRDVPGPRPGARPVGSDAPADADMLSGFEAVRE